MLELRSRGPGLEPERIAAAVQEPLDENLWRVTLHRSGRHLRARYYPAEESVGAVLWLGNGMYGTLCGRLCRALQKVAVACLCLDCRRLPRGEAAFADILAATRFLGQEGHRRFVVLALDRAAEDPAVRLLQRSSAAMAAARVKRPGAGTGARLLRTLAPFGSESRSGSGSGSGAAREGAPHVRLVRLPAGEAGRVEEPADFRLTEWVLRHLEGPL
jgi:hypothetical protein